MGRDSKIEWTDHTFNPWIGCSKISKGCMNCYAERDFDHRYGKVKWGARGTRVKTKPANWKKPLKWNKEAEESGKVQLVFTASLADVFEDWQPGHHSPYLMDEWRGELFALMEQTPWLIWLTLTKRPENVMDMAPSIWKNDWPQNVWIGFSAEDQSNFDFRIGPALAIPTPILWISAEPLLGNINMRGLLEDDLIHWVIAGGESGPNARETKEPWYITLIDQCYWAGAPVFIKQMTKKAPIPSHLDIQHFPNKLIEAYEKTLIIRTQLN